ncbi:MAG: polyamine aminopropyltransferase, partial [Acidobacteriota bacterium]
MDDLATAAPSARAQSWALKACVFATGLTGIVAEYLMATLASYLLGNTVVQWTLVLSLMLFAMGVGSHVSRWLRGDLLDAFIAVELLLSLLSASSAALVYAASIWVDALAPLIYTVAFAIGLLIGIEIPLATRLNERFESLRLNISAVLEKDYYGALLGGLLFAFVALPHLGLTHTPIALGAINLAVAGGLYARFRGHTRRPRRLLAGFVGVVTLLAALVVYAEPLVMHSEQRRYRDRVVYQEQTPYQRIVLTRWRDDHWLYLDGHLQLSTRDEARYHEALVHPAMCLVETPTRVLILGGGDGMALREVLKHDAVEQVTLVDLDPAMVALARSHPALRAANGGSLDDPRATVVAADAYAFLRRPLPMRAWDVILVDLPDPKTIDLARLYSRPFYALAARGLAPGGALVTQATSPFFARRAFLSIWRTVAASPGFAAATGYAVHVPTMGEWGFVIGQRPLPR